MTLLAIALGVTFTFASALSRQSAQIPQQSEGAVLYGRACRTCHDAPAETSRAPATEALLERSVPRPTWAPSRM